MTYSVKQETLHVYACHCLNCQTRSGSAFAEHAMVQADVFECYGATGTFIRTTGGIEFTEHFCPTCHTRLFNQNSMLPEMVFLRAGTLESSQRLEPMAHIWISRKQSWVTLPETIPAFEESPSPEEFGAAVEAATRKA